MHRIEPLPLSLEQARTAFCRHAGDFDQDADLGVLVDPLEGVPLPIYLLAKVANGQTRLAGLVTERDAIKRDRTKSLDTVGRESNDPAVQRQQDLAFSFEVSLRLGKVAPT